MDLSLALLGIGINLAGIALQVSPYQNIWLTLLCAFIGGGCVFLGLFGNRRSVAGGRSLLDRLHSDVINALAIGGALFGAVVLLIILSFAYNIYQRHIDIEAAQAGISIPSPIAEPSP
jgi:hypothetical protein